MPHPKHITQLLEAVAQFTPNLSEENTAHHLAAQLGDKRIVVVWPNQLGEIFFDFVQDGTTLLSESIEYYEAESQFKQAEDVAQVIRNFLLNEIKVETVGSFLKRRELHFLRSGEWVSIFK